MQAFVVSVYVDLIAIDPGTSSDTGWGDLLLRLSPTSPRVKLAMCPVSISELPSEVLEQILLSLHPAEILKAKEVLSINQPILPFTD